MGKTCARCGKEFIAQGTKGCGKRYCSWDCYRPFRGMETRHCLHCGKSFEVEHADRQRYCSWWCSRRPKKTVDITVSPDFGHWLAGLIDGEGCFTILYSYPGKPARQSYYMTRFSMGFRDDDEAMVQDIMNTLQLGNMFHRARQGSSNPQVQIDLMSIADQMQLIRILDMYPLRSKKRRSYEIWREAVLEKAKPTRPSLERLAQLRDEIRVANSYRERHTNL